jgi:hypothetical protein
LRSTRSQWSQQRTRRLGIRDTRRRGSADDEHERIGRDETRLGKEAVHVILAGAELAARPGTGQYVARARYGETLAPRGRAQTAR